MDEFLRSLTLPPAHVVGLRTAAMIWGLDVRSRPDHKLDVLRPRGTPPPDLDCESYEAALPSSHVTTASGVRVTTFSRTALDCARWLPRRDAVAALDQFLRRGADPALLTAMASPAGYGRSKRVRSTLADADRGAESPGESRARVVVLDAGFPRPHTQIPVMGPRGEWVYIDLGYPDLRVGLEYDGERHHSGITARRHDDRRRQWLRREMAWEVIPVCRDFLTRPVPYLEALLTAMLSHGWQPSDQTLETITTRLVRLRHPIGRTVR